MNPTATSLLNAIQRVADTGPEALKQLGHEIKVRALRAASHSCLRQVTQAMSLCKALATCLQTSGRIFSSENVTLALREAHQVLDYLKNDTAEEESITTLGGIFEEEGIAAAVGKMYFGSFLSVSFRRAQLARLLCAILSCNPFVLIDISDITASVAT